MKNAFVTGLVLLTTACCHPCMAQQSASEKYWSDEYAKISAPASNLDLPSEPPHNIDTIKAVSKPLSLAGKLLPFKKVGSGLRNVVKGSGRVLSSPRTYQNLGRFAGAAAGAYGGVATAIYGAQGAAAGITGTDLDYPSSSESSSSPSYYSANRTTSVPSIVSGPRPLNLSSQTIGNFTYTTGNGVNLTTQRIGDTTYTTGPGVNMTTQKIGNFSYTNGWINP